MNPMYVDVTQSSSEVLRLRRAMASGELKRASSDAARVTLQLEDGTPYATEGVLQFSDVTVDASTGAITLRALFPNPDGVLLPNMYVRAVIEEGVRESAILVPQQAVTRDTKGQAIAMVVGANNIVEARTLTTARTIGSDWLVDCRPEAGRPRDRRRPAAGPAGHDRAAARGRQAERGGAGRRRRRRAGSIAAAGCRARQVGALTLPATTRRARQRVAILHRSTHLRVGHRAGDHAGGGAVDPPPADRPVPEHRAADDHHQRDVSGRFGEDRGGHGHPDHRAAHDRAGRPALHHLDQRQRRVGVDRPHVQCRRRSRHRAGAGAEQAEARGSRSCRRRSSSRASRS